MKHSVCVLGGGSFGTALANIMAKNGHQVSQWMRNEEQVEEINLTGLNSRYLPDAPLHRELLATSNLEQAIRDSDTVFVSIPSKSFEQVVQRIEPLLTADKILISTTKGFNPNRFELMSDVLRRNSVTQKIGVLSGPNLAKEIALHELTASVIASEVSDLRQEVQKVLGCGYFRVYASADVQGVELGGALKNIYAVLSGMAAALGVGQNTIGLILSRRLAEMSRFAISLGANPMTFLGLLGVGDLVVTSSNEASKTGIGMEFSDNQVVRPGADLPREPPSNGGGFVVAHNQISQPGEALAIGPAGITSPTAVVGALRPAPHVDVDPFEDPVRSGHATDLLRLDAHELKDLLRLL